MKTLSCRIDPTKTRCVHVPAVWQCHESQTVVWNNSQRIIQKNDSKVFEVNTGFPFFHPDRSPWHFQVLMQNSRHFLCSLHWVLSQCPHSTFCPPPPSCCYPTVPHIDTPVRSQRAPKSRLSKTEISDQSSLNTTLNGKTFQIWQNISRFLGDNSFWFSSWRKLWNPGNTYLFIVHEKRHHSLCCVLPKFTWTRLTSFIAHYFHSVFSEWWRAPKKQNRQEERFLCFPSCTKPMLSVPKQHWTAKWVLLSCVEYMYSRFVTMVLINIPESRPKPDLWRGTPYLHVTPVRENVHGQVKVKCATTINANCAPRSKVLPRWHRVCCIFKHRTWSEYFSQCSWWNANRTYPVKQPEIDKLLHLAKGLIFWIRKQLYLIDQIFAWWAKPPESSLHFPSHADGRKLPRGPAAKQLSLRFFHHCCFLLMSNHTRKHVNQHRWDQLKWRPVSETGRKQLGF